jgi:hypothetical protein
MKRLFAILLICLGLLAPALAPGGASAAGPAACVPVIATIIDDLVSEATPAAYEARGARPLAEQRTQLACNTACARSCSQRFGTCNTRQCMEQRTACIRGCGC